MPGQILDSTVSSTDPLFVLSSAEVAVTVTSNWVMTSLGAV